MKNLLVLLCKHVDVIFPGTQGECDYSILCHLTILYLHS